MITKKSADGNTEKEFDIFQNIRIIEGIQIVLHSSTTKPLHMTANAFFDTFSYTHISLPGKAKTIKNLPEFVVIYHGVFTLNLRFLFHQVEK
jgi:hypothetical protein